MINDTGQRWHIVTENDGEVIFTIKENEIVNVRSQSQTKNDKFYSPRIKIKGTFIKIMDRENEIIEKLKGDHAAYFAITIMRKYLTRGQNVLLKDGKKYKAVDLAKEMGITRQWAARHIRKLKELNVIDEIDTNKGKLLVMNPNYYNRGEDVEQRVYDLFENKKNN